MRKLVLVVVLAVLVGVGYLALTSTEAPKPVLTQSPPVSGDSATLSVAPVRSVITADQDDVTLEYSVGNNGSSPRKYTLEVGEASSKGTPLPDGPQSAARWVTVESTAFTVPVESVERSRSASSRQPIAEPANAGSP